MKLFKETEVFSLSLIHGVQRKQNEAVCFLSREILANLAHILTLTPELRVDKARLETRTHTLAFYNACISLDLICITKEHEQFNYNFLCSIKHFILNY